LNDFIDDHVPAKGPIHSNNLIRDVTKSPSSVNHQASESRGLPRNNACCHGQRAVAVIAAFGPGPFQGDHQRLLETAAALLHSFVPLTRDGDGPNQAQADSDTKRSRIH
jgi:hypothetical protein